MYLSNSFYIETYIKNYFRGGYKIVSSIRCPRKPGFTSTPGFSSFTSDWNQNPMQFFSLRIGDEFMLPNQYCVLF